MNKIYITGWGYTGDGVYFAIAEDGKVLAEHYCSSIDYARGDLGDIHERRRAAYQAHYPDGYEIVFLADGRKPPADVVERNARIGADEAGLAQDCETP